MPTISSQNKEFQDFKQKYNEILTAFLQSTNSSENLLNEGYQFGREAISKNIGTLSVVAIHHDCLIDFLEKLESDQHLKKANKACILLEEVLSSHHMVTDDFSDAIDLLNKRSVEYAVRIRSLQEALKEKGFLLKEVYHRVKNNLQIISSLLNLQLDSAKNQDAQLILKESAARVKSMALIHEMLYQSDNLAKIDMADYIRKLFEYLQEIYQKDFNKIQCHLELDSVLLTLEKAIPCGLVINELITNVFKHAFPGNTQGNIKLILYKQEKLIIVTVSDTGVGVSENINFENSTSLGMQLIRNLTKQLSGTIELDRKQGSTFTLKFANGAE
jgi:two-component sensor histidine kinase